VLDINHQTAVGRRLAKASSWVILVAVAWMTVISCGTTASSPSAAAASAKPSANPLAGLTADQIVSKTTADFKAASSVHVAGWVEESGQTVALDLALGAKGCTGTFEFQGHGSIVLVQIGQTVWIKPDKQFWKSEGGISDPAILQFLAGKYMQGSVKDSSVSGIEQLCDPRQFASLLSRHSNNLVKGKTTTISGLPALQIEDTRNSGSASAYVTISASPEFLRLDRDTSGHLDFTSYNVPMVLTPPPADETVNGAKFGF
jgi:hypothetical protein